MVILTMRVAPHGVGHQVGVEQLVVCGLAEAYVARGAVAVGRIAPQRGFALVQIGVDAAVTRAAARAVFESRGA